MSEKITSPSGVTLYLATSAPGAPVHAFSAEADSVAICGTHSRQSCSPGETDSMCPTCQLRALLAAATGIAPTLDAEAN